jgi:hypothetical protein
VQREVAIAHEGNDDGRNMKVHAICPCLGMLVVDSFPPAFHLFFTS